MMIDDCTHSFVSITRFVFLRFWNAALSILLCVIVNIRYQMSQKVIMAREKLWNKFNLLASIYTFPHVYIRVETITTITKGTSSIWAITGEARVKVWTTNGNVNQNQIWVISVFFFGRFGKRTQNFFCLTSKQMNKKWRSWNTQYHLNHRV